MVLDLLRNKQVARLDLSNNNFNGRQPSTWKIGDFESAGYGNTVFICYMSWFSELRWKKLSISWIMCWQKEEGSIIRALKCLKAKYHLQVEKFWPNGFYNLCTFIFESSRSLPSAVYLFHNFSTESFIDLNHSALMKPYTFCCRFYMLELLETLKESLNVKEGFQSPSYFVL